MLFLGEQYGARRDQMARFLGRRAQRATKIPGEVGATTAQGIIERWCDIGWVQAVSIYKNQPDWLYLTETGLRALGLPYKPWAPPSQGYYLDHKFWVNEVRMLLEEVHPQGRWVSERHIRHTRNLTHYPDGEFHLPHVLAIAIEVECSLKESKRLDTILPWLAAYYENTWYFAVNQAVLVRVRAKRDALALARQERLFISHYDEHNQRWHTSLEQAPRRNVPIEPDPGHIEQAPKRDEQPPVSEVLQELADEWVPPPGNQFGSERLPRLSPAWLPETFEAAVAVAIRLLTPSDQTVLREMHGFTHNEKLREWSHRLREQMGLELWWHSPSGWHSHDANRALWIACGQRDPEEIVFQLMEEVWLRFQGLQTVRRSRQLVRTKPLPSLPCAEWPSTPEEAARQARSLLSPFEELWLYGNKWSIERHDKYPREVWMETLLDQFGLRPPERKGTQEWNEVLWRTAGTAGKLVKEQHVKVREMLYEVMQQVIHQLEQEAKEAQAKAQPEEPLARERFYEGRQAWGWDYSEFKSNAAWGESEASSRHSQASSIRRFFLGIQLLSGVGVLAGLGMLVLGGRALHSILLDTFLVLLGLGVFALSVYLARQDKNRPTPG